MAKGEFILFMDSDDELLSDSLEWRQQKLDCLGSNYASVYCSSILNYKNGSTFKEKVKEVNGLIDGALVGRKGEIPGGAPFHLFRKEVLISENGFNESIRFNEDFELILRIARKWKLFSENRAGFIRHIRNDSFSKKNAENSHKGVEVFLDIALKNNLLPIYEINKRRKENKLSLVKKLLIEKRKWHKVHLYIDQAFKYSGPKGYKELIIYIFNKIYKLFSNHK